VYLPLPRIACKSCGVVLHPLQLTRLQRWLIDHDRHDEGLQTLARLHSGGNTADAYVQAEYEIITAQLADEHLHAAKTYKELFKNKSNTRRIILACAIQASCQMTGISAIQYFSPAIFAQIGISTKQTLLYQGINSAIGEVAQFIFFFLIDSVGRRKMQIGGNLVTCLSFIIGAALLARFPPSTTDTAAHWAFIVASTWLFNFAFCAQGTMSWIVPAEIFNTATRVKGISIATMVSFLFNTMIGQVTSVALAKVGWRFYLLFVVCNFTNALFFYLFEPETRGVTVRQRIAAMRIERVADMANSLSRWTICSQIPPGLYREANGRRVPKSMST